MNKYSRLFLTALPSLYFWYYAFTYTDWHFIDSANLIFHEAGHAIFFFLGEFVQIFMGSGLQILLPLIISIYFFLHQQKISGALCLLWVGQNLLNVSVYAGDAIKMNLPLLGGDNVIHDWNYILGATSLLRYTSTVATIIYTLGILTLFLGTTLALYFAWNYEEKETVSNFI